MLWWKGGDFTPHRGQTRISRTPATPPHAGKLAYGQCSVVGAVCPLMLEMAVAQEGDRLLRRLGRKQQAAVAGIDHHVVRQA